MKIDGIEDLLLDFSAMATFWSNLAMELTVKYDGIHEKKNLAFLFCSRKFQFK